MSLLTVSEKSRTRSYGLLSSRISQTLLDAERTQRPFTEEEIDVLREGLSLLDKFIIGSRLLEGDDFKDGLRPTADTIRAYRYGISTLSTLEQLHHDDEVAETFADIRTKLEAVVIANNAAAIDQSELGILKEFFTVLATALCEDLVRLRLEGRAADKSVNHFSHAARA